VDGLLEVDAKALSCVLGDGPSFEEGHVLGTLRFIFGISVIISTGYPVRAQGKNRMKMCATR
jgi:hypothetical protein